METCSGGRERGWESKHGNVNFGVTGVKMIQKFFALVVNFSISLKL